jgi:prepilin-type N-terminal cleavage/methylation domain-containing protein
MRNRRGATLVELLVAMVIMGVIGAAITGLMTSQSRFFNQQEGRGNARRVARSATSIILSDLRSVERSGGVVAASGTSITLRVPYSQGIVCAAAAGSMTVSLPPIDSVRWAGAAFSGYAWRDTLGVYNYVDPGTAVAAATSAQAAVCGTATIDTIPTGRVVVVTPGVATGPTAGTPVFLFQRIRYQFATSTLMPGRLALLRTLVTPNTTEELVAPFDSTAGFRFYTAGSATSTSTVPAPLSDIVGFDLQLVGLNDRAPSSTAADQAPLTTAVFFQNR